MTPEQQKHLRTALAKIFEGRMELESLRNDVKLDEGDEAEDFTSALDEAIDAIEASEDDLEPFKGLDEKST